MGNGEPRTKIWRFALGFTFGNCTAIICHEYDLYRTEIGTPNTGANSKQSPQAKSKDSWKNVHERGWIKTEYLQYIYSTLCTFLIGWARVSIILKRRPLTSSMHNEDLYKHWKAVCHEAGKPLGCLRKAD